MRRAKSSDMRHKIKVYRQVNVRNKEKGTIDQKWLYEFSIWCREITIFREQLETIVSGSQMLRNRKEFECRYTKKLTTRNRIAYQGKLWQISIVGDTEGHVDRIRFLAEVLEDGGA